MTKKRDFSKELNFLFLVMTTVIILLLSIFNLQSQPKTKTVVLGASDNKEYWQEITSNHPSYRDAWVELGRYDKVYEIDPNYIIK